MIQYDANTDIKYQNGCMIFATVTAWSNTHNIVLSYPQIDLVYKAINRKYSKGGIWKMDNRPLQSNDIPKILNYLDETYGTTTYTMIPREWRWNWQTNRNLRKWWRTIISMNGNNAFKSDVTADGILNDTARVDWPRWLWHQCCLIIENDEYYIVDIFGNRKHNKYLIKPNQFEKLKQRVDKEFFIITK